MLCNQQQNNQMSNTTEKNVQINFVSAEIFAQLSEYQ